MSETELYAFKGDGQVYQFATTRNSHRGAPVVWGYITRKYLSGVDFDTIGGNNEALWISYKKPEMTRVDRIVLLSTFDQALCAKEDLPELIAAFRAFEVPSSLPEQADKIEKIMNDDDLVCIGWNQTSVNGDHWGNAGGVDEDEEWLPYDLKTGGEHFNIFHTASCYDNR